MSAYQVCLRCGRDVRVQIQKNTGYCTPTCRDLQEQENEEST